MERIRIVRQLRKRKPRVDVLPLDPRDPDILRAKTVREGYRPPPRRAA